ncbi:MAG: enoyl-CoA hydratase/isomerase family protein [Deltaproteobacteria bacterium]|nr:enoyl-CoA hydratase/isomerase family protein [Deltaproteobacteria bacterium]
MKAQHRLSLVQSDRCGEVLVLTLDRPPVNALNREVLADLAAALDQLGDARAVVITGGGGKAFVAGADIAAMKDLDPVTAMSFAAEGQAVLDRLEALPVPVIAAVNGFALGGGCELAMACDIILAAPGAQFGQPEVKLGVIPGFGGTQRLVRRVGSQRARELCFTGRVVKADEAVAIGLALKVCDDVVAEALAMAEAIAKNGPVAVRLCKRAILDGDGLPLGAALVAERQLFGLCFATADQREGMAAFLEKRKPNFTGA